MRLAAVALALAVALPARADPPAIQLASVTASSVLGARGGPHAAFRAFDADTRTGWCPARKDASGSLTISFEQPVHVRALTLYGSERHGEHQLPLLISDDAGTVHATFAADSDLGQEMAVPPSPTRSLRFQFGALAARDRPLACLWEIELEVTEGPLIYGVTPAARDALPEALTGINQALADCDAKRLPSWVRFPVRFRETAMVFAHHRSYSGEESVLARTAAKLNCNMLHDDGPRIDQGIAPGLVRVVAGSGTTTAYWEVRWTGAGWRLTGLDTVFFE